MKRLVEELIGVGILFIVLTILDVIQSNEISWLLNAVEAAVIVFVQFVISVIYNKRKHDFSKRHPIPVGDEDISLRINVKDK